ncbi:DNA recombination protein RmuC [Actinomyces lilanjuaniae]|uniref:DNA recombination protein RmuC n=1 Tax=Actinomyces lilanjuaniae TaxID=2321394 RepID=UPI00311A989E
MPSGTCSAPRPPWRGHCAPGPPAGCGGGRAGTHPGGLWDDAARGLCRAAHRRLAGPAALRQAFQRRRPSSPSHLEGAELARPDVVIHLPGEGYLALDAKVPMDSYLEAARLGTATQEEQDRRTALLTAHAKALRSHVDQLASRRYDRALGSSPEIVVLFVPAEPVLAAALETDTSLMEHALERGVALTSPASLLALLRTCATAWARTAVNDDARDLLELGRTLYDRLSTLARHLDDLGRALRRSVSAYNKTVGSLENRLLVTARSLEVVGSEPHSPTPIGPDEAQLRSLTAAELSGADQQEESQTAETYSREVETRADRVVEE